MVNLNQSSFIAVYGRRRIGKTYLIRETFDYRFTFQHSGINSSNSSDQLTAFYNSIIRQGLPSCKRPKNWFEAFELLKTLIEKSKSAKKIIFLDELSWMDTKNGKFLMSLESFWNGWASARKDIVLIICASATTWMLCKIIHNKGGLYNRLSLQIHLKPWHLKECEKYCQAYSLAFSRQDILELFMAIGGVPYYWTLLDPAYSLNQNIDRLFFNENAILKNEYDFLFSSLFSKPDVYVNIIEKLSLKRKGLTRKELLELSKLPNNGDFSKAIADLESSNFIRVYQEYGKKKKDSLIQIIDNFIVFYFQVVKPHKNIENYYERNSNTASLNVWRGFAFERVVFHHVLEIKKALGINGIGCQPVGYCSYNDDGLGLQIDLLLDRDDRTVNICEIKFSYEQYEMTKDSYASIVKKVNDFRNGEKYKGAIQVTLISPYGLKLGAYSSIVNSTVTLDDLFV